MVPTCNIFAPCCSPSSLFPLPGPSNLCLVSAPFQAGLLPCFPLSCFSIKSDFLFNTFIFKVSIVRTSTLQGLFSTVFTALSKTLYTRFRFQVILKFQYSPISAIPSVMGLAFWSLESEFKRDLNFKFKSSHLPPPPGYLNNSLGPLHSCSSQ